MSKNSIHEYDLDHTVITMVLNLIPTDITGLNIIAMFYILSIQYLFQNCSCVDGIGNLISSFYGHSTQVFLYLYY